MLYPLLVLSGSKSHDRCRRVIGTGRERIQDDIRVSVVYVHSPDLPPTTRTNRHGTKTVYKVTFGFLPETGQLKVCPELHTLQH
jgi:hypothetical protein